MKKMFKKIIGYEEVKETLSKIIDVLNNQEKYRKQGATIPHGLMLWGSPGVGKSTFAFEFIKNTNRKSFTIKKSKSDGDFIKYVNKIFDSAVKNQPSVILLDDLDKFSDTENPNSEEYVAIQTLIDEVKDKDVFVLATTNNKYSLPKTLRRSGRFDNIIYIDIPNENDTYEIIKHYLSKKKLDKTVNIKNISVILDGTVGADLEKVCNQASIYAGYLNKEAISMDEILEAALEFKYDSSINNVERDNKYVLKTAYHEAGHVLIGELFEPGSTSYVTVAESSGDINGITKSFRNENYYDDIELMKNKVKTLLSGKAAVEVEYKTCDTGSGSDINSAYNLVNRFVSEFCMCDFNSFVKEGVFSSEKAVATRDNNISAIITEYYNEVKELIIANKNKLDRLAKELMDKKILFKDDIKEIMTS